jgi:hypothetical protein
LRMSRNRISRCEPTSCISEKLSFDEYANDPRFRFEIPSHGIIQERGDNMYFKDQNGDWKQRLSYHTKKQIEDTKKQMEADLIGEYVLISDHFFYFGANAVLVPERFRRLMSTGRWSDTSSVLKSLILLGGCVRLTALEFTESPTQSLLKR